MLPILLGRRYMKAIQQHDQRDCGAACLAMIAGYYGLKLPISKCRELTKTDRSGTNIYGLVTGAEQLGFQADGMSGNAEQLMQALSSGELRFPFVSHIIRDGAMQHYVVVYGMRRGKFLVADPDGGKKLRLPLDRFWSCWTGYVVSFTPTARFRKGNERKGNFSRFFSLLRGQYRKLAAILVLSLLISAIGILGSFVFQIVMDDFAAQEDTSSAAAAEAEDPHTHEEKEEGVLEHALETVAARAGSLHLIFITLIGLYLLQAAIQLARSYLIVLLSKKIDLRLTLRYYNHIIALPVSSISLRQTGEYLSRFSDAATIRQAVSTATVTLVMDALMAAACGVILYRQNRQLFTISLLMLVLYAAVVLIFRKPLARSNRSTMERDALLQAYLKESIDGAQTIKAARAEAQVRQKTTKKFGDFLNAMVKSSMLSAAQDTLCTAIELIGTILILWRGFSLALAGQITLGSVITFYALLAYFTEPIKSLIELQPTLQTAFVAADRLNDILDLQCEQLEEAAAAEPAPAARQWEFRGVDFRYGNRELTLQGIDLCLRRGEKIAIVGESGSGKTTLAKLLMGFYQPERGEILLNGEKLSALPLAALRQKVAYVDQNTFLFSDTVLNNLRLGNPQASMEEIERVCQISRAAGFIACLPMGYDTPLDENGMNLSGGQRQRLAIARALLRKPELLILDEATSNLDTITESAIRDTVFGLGGELTCMIIAHRLSTIRQCDRIYVMDAGRIVESGTHEALWRLGGIYRRMWERGE